MEKEKKERIRIICVKAPRWTVPILKLIYRNKNKEE